MGLIVITFSLNSWAAGKRALGLMLGNPTGISGKYELGANRAVDAGVGLSFGRHTNASIHSDYLLHKEGVLFFKDVHALDLYYGIGGRMEFADTIELGARVPIGLLHQLEGRPAEVFGEVAPVIDLIGRQGTELHLLFGARYYF